MREERDEGLAWKRASKAFVCGGYSCDAKEVVGEILNHQHRPLMTSSSANLSIDTADSDTESLSASSSSTLYARDMAYYFLARGFA